MKRLIPIVLVLLGGCSPNGDANNSAVNADHTNLVLRYAGSGDRGDGTHGVVPPFGTCALTAPGETLVLARATRDFESTLYAPCHPQQPYLDGHLTADLEVLRQSGPPVPAQISASLWFPSSAELEVGSRTPAGTIVLASLRRAGEEWVAMAAVIVETTAANGATEAKTEYTRHGRLITLPAAWSDLMTEVSALRADYATVCDENPRYFGGSRAMTDDEFDTHIHTPIPQECAPTPDAGVEPIPDAG